MNVYTSFPIKENLLYFIWEFRYFDTKNLKTATGESLTILDTGHFNTHEGADFQNAKIKIDNIILVGSIEIHVKSSDWERHKHQENKHYKNTILHVVWEEDKKYDFPISVLTLKEITPKIMLSQYQKWLAAKTKIPCQENIKQTPISDLFSHQYAPELLKQRMIRKIKTLQKTLKATSFYWEETFWISLFRTLGITQNANTFEDMARRTPLRLFLKHKNNPLLLEALLFGQAGLLTGSFEESHPTLLQKEYAYLQRKYNLEKTPYPIYFFRMHPANFPTIRLAQIAQLFHQSDTLFSKLLTCNTLLEIYKVFDITLPLYWHHHYHFDKPTPQNIPKKLGKSVINLIIINTIVPIRYAYWEAQKKSDLAHKTLTLLNAIPAEQNHITRYFKSLSFECRTADTSQALIELYTNHCLQKNCLHCKIGQHFLQSINNKKI